MHDCCEKRGVVVDVGALVVDVIVAWRHVSMPSWRVMGVFELRSLRATSWIIPKTGLSQ